MTLNESVFDLRLKTWGAQVDMDNNGSEETSWFCNALRHFEK